MNLFVIRKRNNEKMIKRTDPVTDTEDYTEFHGIYQKSNITSELM